MFHQALVAAQAGGVDEQPQATGDLDRPSARAGHLETEHATRAAHLRQHGRPLRMAVEAGVVHRADPCVTLQELGDRLGIALMPVQPRRQCAQAAQHQPAGEGVGHGAEQFARFAHGACQFIIVGKDQGATADITMAGQILGGRVHDHIGAQRQRLQQQWRGKGGIDHQHGTGGAGDIGQCGHRAQLQQRVGGCFRPQTTGIGTQRSADLIGIAHVDQGQFQIPARKPGLGQLAHREIGVVSHQHMAARRQILQQRRYGGHARGKGQRAGAAIQRRQRGFQPILGGIGIAAVEKAAGLSGIGRMFESGGQMDRRRHRAGFPIDFCCRMHGNGFQAHLRLRRAAICGR